MWSPTNGRWRNCHCHIYTTYVRAGNGISVRQFIIKSAGRIIGIKRLQMTSPVLNSHSTHGKWNLCSPTRPLFYRVPLGYYIQAPTLECRPWTMIIPNKWHHSMICLRNRTLAETSHVFVSLTKCVSHTWIVIVRHQIHCPAQFNIEYKNNTIINCLMKRNLSLLPQKSI